MKKFLTSVIMVVAAMSMVVTSADAKSRASSRSSFSSSKSSSYSFKSSSSSYKPSSSSYSSSSYKPSTSYNKPSTTVSSSASSYTVKPVVPVATKPTVTSPASYAPSTPAVLPTSKASTAIKAAGVGAVATAGAVATHNALASDHHDSAATMANVASSTSTIPVPSTEQHVADNSNVTSDSTTTVPVSSVKTDKPLTVSLDKKDTVNTAATPPVKPAVSVVDTQVKPAVKNVQNVNVVNKNVNRPQNRTAQNMMTYYALRNMHRPTRGYHTYSSNTYSNKALSSSDWERAANATGVYTNHFDSVNTFEEKSLKECTGEVYSCDNTNSDDFVYDVALYQGFLDAMGSRANSYGVPDLQNRVYAKFQSDYQNNKYRLEKIASKMKGDDVTVSIVKQAYFTGYAAGLYTIKNRL